MTPQLSGFDYRICASVCRPIREWREQLSAVIAAGGSRRVRLGETYAHDKSGKLLFEVYGIVQVLDAAVTK